MIHRTLGGPETDRSGTHPVVVVQRGRKVQPTGISARAPDQGFEFCPHDAGMHAPVERSLSKTAVGTRDDVLAADQLSDPYDSLADEFGMLDQVGCVANHARHQHFAGREFDFPPEEPFVRSRAEGSRRFRPGSHSGEFAAPDKRHEPR